MSLQFPPSSPLRDEKEYKKHDPFFDASKGSTRGRDAVSFEYPTPHPSSSIGRTSSPPRESDYDHYVRQSEPKKVSFDINKPVMSGTQPAFYGVLPRDSKVTRIPLAASEFTVGRSSRLSDLVVRTRDRAMSRKHLKISHNADKITIECLGANGYGITVPLSCDVNKVSDFEYELVECSRSKLKEQIKNTKLSKTIKLTDRYTEFLVQKGEVITLPLLENLVIEIKSNILVVNPRVENEETDDEVFEKSTQAHSKQTPDKPMALKPSTPVKRAFKITSEESTPIKHVKVPAIKTPVQEKKAVSVKTPVQERLKTAARTPLKDITNAPMKGKSEEPSSKTHNSPAQPAVHSNGHARSRSASDMPAPSVETAPVYEQTPEPEADMSTVNIGEIKNILVNHLAFSRLASTKLTMLKGVSEKINELSSSQLKELLKEIRSIGVIYRDGKDAAGKPLDPEYYYIPEEDDDENRKSLVESIKGHGGIRRCRTTHKQYYWKKPAPIKNKAKK